MTEKAIDRKQAVAELLRSSHGHLSRYVPVALQMARTDADFMGRLVSYDHIKGVVRDAHIALPVLASVGYPREDYLDNAMAHLADLPPRELLRAVNFAQALRTGSTAFTLTRKPRPVSPGTLSEPEAPLPVFGPVDVPLRTIRRLTERYLRNLEADRQVFERVAVLHHWPVQQLYARFRMSRPEWVGRILFHREQKQIALPDGIFAIIRQLHVLDPPLAAGLAKKYRIPYLVLMGALGNKADTPSGQLAVLQAMSPTEVVTNAKKLKKMGVKADPAMRAAFAEALARVEKSTTATLKTTAAAEALADDPVLASKLHAVQEKQLDALDGIEGNWLICGDKSGSMEQSIEVSRMVAGITARTVKGKVLLCFFDSEPRFFDVTGATYEAIKALTSGVVAGGGTNMAAPLKALLDKKIVVDGIVYVGDGGNNTDYANRPLHSVAKAYQTYTKKMDVEPTLYFYQTQGSDPNSFSPEMSQAGLDVVTFDLCRTHVDYHSLPSLVQTMKVGRYTLIDDIQGYPLRTVDEVLTRTVGYAVLPKVLTTA